MRRYQALVAAIFFVFAALFIYKTVLKSALTDEEQMAAAVKAIADAAEERDVRTISGYLDKDFIDDEVRLDRDSTLGIIRHVFIMYKKISVDITGLTVNKTDAKTGSAKFLAKVYASQQADGRGEDLMRHRGSGRFILTFKKIDGKWMITRSSVEESTAD